MKNLIKKIFILIFFLSVYLNVQTALACFETPNTKVNVKESDTWENFRKVFPFHIQTLAYHKQNEILIITEPPPHVTIENLKEVAPELGNIEIKQHAIGCDGWIKDLVIELPQITDEKRNDLFDRINLYLFRTTYKADVLNLPAKKPAIDNSDTPLDVKITFSDLKDWLLDKNEAFESILTGEIIQFNTIFSQKKNGVFFSKEPGLVVWAINRKTPLTNNLAEARQFSLDSDLIVGAVSDANTLAIVGRKRMLPLDFFPPLRTETILQLAAVKNPDLGQSYERNYVFAGRFNEKDDWAPIYLSDELIDTEYGSLLNITDQILKRWSMRGTVDYKNFESYNDPSDFPFKDKTLVEYLKNVPEVTFNWNTFGLGYSSEINGKRIFAINRTGALPTSYLSGDQDNYSEAEEIGYSYFAEVGDPNLTRVVQYAALYQIFQDSKVTAGNDAFSFKKYSPSYEELYQELIKTINKIKATPASDVNYLATGSSESREIAVAIEKVKEFNNRKDFEASARSILDPRNLNNQFNKRIDEYYKTYRGLNKKLKDLESSINSKISEKNRIVEKRKRVYDEYTYTNLCPGSPKGTGTPKDILCTALFAELDRLNAEVARLTKIINGREAEYYSTQNRILNVHYDFGVFIDFSKALGKASKKFVSQSDANRLKEIYLKSLPERDSKWIHTPSIVVSDSNNFYVVGGHNLLSKTTVFKTGMVPRGKVSITPQGVIIINPKDINNISSLVRTVGKKSEIGDVSDLKKSLEQELAAPKLVAPRPKPAALEFAKKPQFINQDSDIGWSSAKRVEAFEDDIIKITKNKNGTETINYQNREVIANTPTSRNNYISEINYGGKNPAKIRTEGFDPKEVKALTGSLSIKQVGVDRSPIPVKGLRAFGIGGKVLVKDFDFANAKIGSPQVQASGTGVQARTKVVIDIEVPLASSPQTGIYAKIESLFKGLWVGAKERQLTKRFGQILDNKFRVNTYEPEMKVSTVVSEVQNEIKKEFPEVLDVKFFMYEDATVSEFLRQHFKDYANAE